MFVFKLKALLDYRTQQEDTCQQRLAEARRSFEAERGRLEQYQQHWRRSLEQWRTLQQRDVSVVGIDLYQKYILRLRQEIMQQGERVRERLHEVDSRREELITAMQERRKIENLRKLALERYRHGEKIKDRTFLDDLATQRFNRKGSMW